VRSSELRAELAALLLEVGPDHPTLCTGWTTRDLAAHLFVREHRLDALPGIAIPWFASHTDHIQDQVAQRPFPDVVAGFAAGPSITSPFRIPALAEAANIAEFSIHREDVRRSTQPWQPLVIPDQDTLWRRLAVIGRVTARRSPVTILAVRTDAPGHMRFGHSSEQIVMRGAPLEILLRLTGRTEADVEFFGSEGALAAFSRSHLHL
jgi:uncharacterized protein (TIGR03085 family)